jgi:hypothetical protein
VCGIIKGERRPKNKAAFVLGIKNMKYAALIVSMVAAAAAIGCSGGFANNVNTPSSKNSAVASPIPIVETPTSKGNECKICSFDIATYKGELKKDEIDGLLLALNDEYLATATYEQVNKDFNDPRPFVNIVQAEMRHAEMLKSLFARYGVNIQENPWRETVPKFTDLKEACKAGVQGEILNRDLYTKLFKSTERKDILDTYRYLQAASEENHLPAFERCGGGGRGPGNGRGPRGNW